MLNNSELLWSLSKVGEIKYDLIAYAAGLKLNFAGFRMGEGSGSSAGT